MTFLFKQRGYFQVLSLFIFQGVLCSWLGLFNMSFLSSQSLGIYKGGFHWFTHPSPSFQASQSWVYFDGRWLHQKGMYIWGISTCIFFGIYRKRITKLIHYHVLMYLSCVYRFIIVLNVLQPFGDIRHAIYWFGVHRASSFLVVSCMAAGWQHIPTINENKFTKLLVVEVEIKRTNPK